MYPLQGAHTGNRAGSCGSGSCGSRSRTNLCNVVGSSDGFDLENHVLLFRHPCEYVNQSFIKLFAKEKEKEERKEGKREGSGGVQEACSGVLKPLETTWPIFGTSERDPLLLAAGHVLEAGSSATLREAFFLLNTYI